MSEQGGDRPAGWYPDPEMADTVRYWDGSAWTGHLAPASGAPATPLTSAAPSAPAHPSRGSGRWLLIAGGVVALVLLIGAAAFIATRGENAPSAGADAATTPTPTASDTTASAGPAAFNVSGQLDLVGRDNWLKVGGNCFGVDGYDDIDSGAQVVIRDGDGTKVAIGALEDGYVQNGDCIFLFFVTDVPEGGGVYSVEVAHRGEVAFSESEAGVLHLTLGS